MSETTQWQTDKLSGACGYWPYWLRQMLCWAEGHSGKWKLKSTEDSAAREVAHFCLIISSGQGCSMFSPCRCDFALDSWHWFNMGWRRDDRWGWFSLLFWTCEKALSQHQQPSTINSNDNGQSHRDVTHTFLRSQNDALNGWYRPPPSWHYLLCLTPS